MYEKFFGLVKNPFSISPDPSFLFSTTGARMAYASLYNAIRARNGLILLVGEAGTGKTLLLRKLAEQLHDEATATAFVPYPRLSAAEFFDFVLTDFGLEHDFSDSPISLKIFQEWLHERTRMGRTAVLIIDEAQDLSIEVFDLVRQLSNLEGLAERSLQIILSGQLGIEEKVRQPGLGSISQKIDLRVRTRPLNHGEISQYIDHRLRVAGGHVESVFTREAIKAVYWSSGGIPRLVNLICDHALISGYVEQRKPVGATLIRDVARQFDFRVEALFNDFATEDVLQSLTTDAPRRGISNIRSFAGPPVQTVGEHVSSKTTETPLQISAQTNARPSADVALTPGEEERVEPVATWEPEAVENHSGIPRVISQPGKQPVSEREVIRSDRPMQPVELKNSSDPQSSSMTQWFSPMPQVPRTAPEASDSTKEFPGAQPVEGTEPADVACSARSICGGSSEAQQLLLERKKTSNSGFDRIDIISHKPAREWFGHLQWAMLVLISMVAVIGGYYLVGGGLFTNTRRGELLYSGKEPLTSGSSPTNSPAGGRRLSPPGGTEVSGHKRVPSQPLSPMPSANVGQTIPTPAESVKEELPSGPARLLSRVKPKSSELQGSRKQHAIGTTVRFQSVSVGQLAVLSNVPGATVILDGRSDPNWTTPHVFTDLAPGGHSVVVSKQGYREAEQRVTVGAGQEASVNTTLTPLSGVIEISTGSRAAEVLIDGKSYGSSPIRAEVDPGIHTVLVRQSGRKHVEWNLVVQPGAVVQRTVVLPLEPLAPPVKNVAVTTNPYSATVYADGDLIGDKTPTSFHLSPGQHTLIFFAAGYRPVRREIDVPEGGVLKVSAILPRQ